MLLKDLDAATKAHWTLHLNKSYDELVALRTEIRNYVQSKSQLPSIRHPAFIHDWLEHPEMRIEIEGWNG